MCFESFGGGFVCAFVEVAVDVEDGLDAGMSEASRDDRRVCALLDKEGDVAVAEVVESHRWAHRAGDGGEPESAAEGIAADGSTFGCGEGQPVGAGWMPCEVIGEDLGEPGWDGDSSAGGGGLGLENRRWPRTSLSDRSIRMVRRLGS